MAPLTTPDTHHLKAARGWLELGNHMEANEELEKITASLRSHPDVLEVRWQIYAKAGEWQACYDIGQAIVRADPKRPLGWIHRSVALHRLKRTQDAYDQLEAAAGIFTDSWHVRYDLACYACQLGFHDEAWEWLTDAFDLGDGAKLKLMALDDPDLEPFWAEIGEN